MAYHRHRPVVLALILGLTPSLAAQRTAEQRYFEWTTLPFPPPEFAARRMALVHSSDHAERSRQPHGPRDPHAGGPRGAHAGGWPLKG